MGHTEIENFNQGQHKLSAISQIFGKIGLKQGKSHQIRWQPLVLYFSKIEWSWNLTHLELEYILSLQLAKINIEISNLTWKVSCLPCFGSKFSYWGWGSKHNFIMMISKSGAMLNLIPKKHLLIGYFESTNSGLIGFLCSPWIDFSVDLYDNGES